MHSAATEQMMKTIPLSDQELIQLYQGIEALQSDAELVQHVQLYQSCFNTLVLQAINACMLDGDLKHHPEQVIKRQQKVFNLNKRQNRLLENIVHQYNRLSSERQKRMQDYFSFSGVISHYLVHRDKLLYLLHRWLLSLCDHDAIAASLMDYWHTHVFSLEQIIDYLPSKLRAVCFRLFQGGALTEYSFLNELEKNILERVCVAYEMLSPTEKQKISTTRYYALYKSNPMVKCTRPRKQRLIQRLEKERKHQLLSFDEFSKVLAYAQQQLPWLPDARMKRVLNAYQKIIEPMDTADEYINEFYIALHQLLRVFDSKEWPKDLAQSRAHEAVQDTLSTLLHLSFNALINARLDKVNIFAPTLKNPLTATSMQQWLLELERDNTAFRIFVSQQFEQSPSLAHALCRCKSIFATIEPAKNNERLRKTGVQRFVRAWQRGQNTSFHGCFYQEDGIVKNVPPGTLFSGSKTMEHAQQRVAEKRMKFAL